MRISSRTPLIATRIFGMSAAARRVDLTTLTVNASVQVPTTVPCVASGKTTVPMLEEVRVDMADMRVESRPVTLVTCVGSCVAICLHDPIHRCGGLAHIMLPSGGKDGQVIPCKYAESAVPALIEGIREVTKQDCLLTAKIAGGADMFSKLKCTMLKIGERNVEAVKQALQARCIRLLGEDVGGTNGRRISFNVVNNEVVVRSLNGVEKKL